MKLRFTTTLLTMAAVTGLAAAQSPPTSVGSRCDPGVGWSAVGGTCFSRAEPCASRAAVLGGGLGDADKPLVGTASQLSSCPQ